MPSRLDSRSVIAAKLQMRLLHRRTPCTPPFPQTSDPAPAKPLCTASSPQSTQPSAPPAASCPTLPPSAASKPPLRPCKDAVSCPALSVDAMDSDHQPSLLRRGSHPVYKLPLLNFSALSEPSVDDLHTARRRVESLSNSLSRFRPYLYVCGDVPARDLAILKRHAITHVVNLGGRGISNHFPDKFKYLRLCIRDDVREDIRPVLMAVITFIDDARANGGTVLVHCKQGISRSVTTALAYVMAREAVSLEDAMKDMRKCRPIANPNAAFYQALSDMEARMRHGVERTTALVARRHAEALRDWETPYVAVVVKGVMVEGDAYILHRQRRNGVVVWRGRSATEDIWRKAIRLGEEISKQEMIDAARFANSKPVPGIKLVQQGEDYGVDEEIQLAMMP